MMTFVAHSQGGVVILPQYKRRNDMQINPMVNDSETSTILSTIHFRRSGKVCLVSLSNYISPTAIATDTKICDLPVSTNMQTFGVAKTLGNADVLLFASGNGLYVSGITGLPAGVNVYGTIEFLID